MSLAATSFSRTCSVMNSPVSPLSPARPNLRPAPLAGIGQNGYTGASLIRHKGAVGLRGDRPRADWRRRGPRHGGNVASSPQFNAIDQFRTPHPAQSIAQCRYCAIIWTTASRCAGSLAARDAAIQIVDRLERGNHAPQSDPRRRLGGPLSERRSGARFANALDSQLQPVATPIPRETVQFGGREAPGTIIVRTGERRLYLVLPDHQALRYGVGVGRPGFTWAGATHIGYKREWPDWTPPAQMLRRRPDLPRHMQGGPDNPLGARAMYLAGTLYRIHGSNEPDTIGHAVSSGCIRMTNDDVIDLYGRARVGARVVVTR